MPTSHPDHRPTLHAADGPVLFFQLRRRVVWAAADAGVRRMLHHISVPKVRLSWYWDI